MKASTATDSDDDALTLERGQSDRISGSRMGTSALRSDIVLTICCFNLVITSCLRIFHIVVIQKAYSEFQNDGDDS